MCVCVDISLGDGSHLETDFCQPENELARIATASLVQCWAKVADDMTTQHKSTHRWQTTGVFEFLIYFCLLLRPFFPPFAKINISDGVGKTEIKHKKISNCDLEWNCYSEENRSFLLSARLQIVAVRNQMKTFLLAFVYKSRHPTDESVLLYCLRQQLSRAKEKWCWH